MSLFRKAPIIRCLIILTEMILMVVDALIGNSPAHLRWCWFLWWVVFVMFRQMSEFQKHPEIQTTALDAIHGYETTIQWFRGWTSWSPDPSIKLASKESNKLLAHGFATKSQCCLLRWWQKIAQCRTPKLQLPEVDLAKALPRLPSVQHLLGL